MLPDDVRTLLRDHVTSFECLELLLILHSRSEPGSAQALSGQAGIAIALATPALAALESSQLVRRDTTEPPNFRFAPATTALSRAVDDLERSYRDQRAAVMSEMSVNAIARIRSGTLRAFSDAFVFGKKKDPDG
jgi:DNA-binding IclR family transcriptional regulator